MKFGSYSLCASHFLEVNASIVLEDVDIIVQGHNLPYSRLIRRQKLLSSMWVLSGVQIEMRPDLVTSLWEPAHGAIRRIVEWISR